MRIDRRNLSKHYFGIIDGTRPERKQKANETEEYFRNKFLESWRKENANKRENPKREI